MSRGRGGLVRLRTESDPEGPGTSRITPVRLADAVVQVTEDFLYAPEPLVGQVDDLSFDKGTIASKNALKIQASIEALGLRGASQPSSVIYEIRRRNGKRYVQGAFTALKAGAETEHIALKGDAIGSKPKHVTVVTGGCLGSNRGTVAVMREGLFGRQKQPFQLGSHGADEKAVKRLLFAGFNPGLTFYEYEVIWRSASEIAKLILQSSGDISWTIRLDVPCVEYYTYILRWVERRRISRGTAIEWFNHVDARSRAVRDYFAALLRKMLGGALKRRVKLVEKDELAPVGHYLREEFRPWRRPSLRGAVDVMRSQGNPIWNAMLSPAIRPQVVFQGRRLAPEVESVQQLCGASYTIAPLDESQQADVVLSVNDPQETTIEDSVMAFRPVIALRYGLQFSPSVGWYPLGKILPGEPGQIMYRSDPGREVILSNPDRLGVRYQDNGVDLDVEEPEKPRFLREDGIRLDPVNLLPLLYAV